MFPLVFFSRFFFLELRVYILCSCVDYVDLRCFSPPAFVITVQYISMCPDGVEGTTYAILTTMSNVSASAAYNVGTHMTKIWDVSNEALRSESPQVKGPCDFVAVTCARSAMILSWNRGGVLEASPTADPF